MTSLKDITSLILSVVSMAFVSCVADVDFTEEPNPGRDVISVMSSEARITRSSSRLSSVIKDFKLYGVKQTGAGSFSTVFDNYVVWYAENSAGTTTTNTRDWEYVGTLPTGPDYSLPTCQTVKPQEVKYWDNDASRYVFWGVGRADQLTAFATTNGTTYTTTIASLKEADLNSPSQVIYYSQPKVVGRTSYRQPVQLEFRRFVSRVRFGFYETIPGYAVKDVQFYTPAVDAAPTADCTLSGQYLKDGNKLNITYDIEPATPTLTLDYAAGVSYNDTHSFGPINYTIADDNQLQDANDRRYLGKFSSAATYAGNGEGYYTNIFPNPDNRSDLKLHVDYTLLSTDGSGQTIEVKHATAIVPAAYCQWKPNYSYTYLFKISDNTNGSTGADVVGLYPITFTAYAEIAGTDNNQIGTITTFGEWSITTHQKNDVLNGGIVYYKGKSTEVSAIKADGSKDEKVFLKDPKDYVVIYHQLTNNEWEIESTTSESLVPDLGVYKETIDRYENGFAYFTPDVAGTYRIEYWHQEGSDPAVKRAVKIMKVEDKVGFNIHYELNGHGNPVLDGESLLAIPTSLPVPIDDDLLWSFSGWYLDAELTQPVVPGVELTDDITLYAKWLKAYTGQDLEDTNMTP